MLEEGQRIITTIRQMETSLDDVKNNVNYHVTDDQLKISYPLTQCLQNLKEKHKTISQLHQERYEQVKSMSHSPESRKKLADLRLQNSYKPWSLTRHIWNHLSLR